MDREQALPAARILARLSVVPGAVAQALAQVSLSKAAEGDLSAPGSGEPALTPAARDAVERAYALAADLHDEYIGGEHLLLAFAQSPGGSDAACALAALGVTWQSVGRALMLLQTWRTQAPPHMSLRLPARRVVRHLRGRAGQVKCFAHGAAHWQQPLMPLLLFRKRHTDSPYRLYARLRRRPAYWDALMGHWIITRYEDVAWALAEPRLSQRVFDTDAWEHDNLPPLVEREFRRVKAAWIGRCCFKMRPISRGSGCWSRGASRRG